MKITSPLLALTFGLLMIPAAHAEDSKPPLPQLAEGAGEWLKLPEDRSPWKHPHSDLRFPQELAGFTLKHGFEDKRPEAGIALTYVHPKQDVKADIILYPCPKQIATMVDIMPAVTEVLRHTARDLRETAEGQGYKEDESKRGNLETGKIDLWESGIIPAAQMKMELVAKEAGTEAEHPTINQWLNLILYQDFWIQTSVVMPSKLGAEGEKLRVEFITRLIQIIREPSLLAQLVLICDDYMRGPLTDAGREGADHLLAFSKESPIFEIATPGEAITPALNELASYAPGAEKDVLRGFIIGSGAKNLLGENLDAQLEEGARVMVLVYRMLKKENVKVLSPTLEDIGRASDDKKAADWLRKRMNAPRPE